MYQNIYWCDFLQLPNPPGGDMHGVRCPKLMIDDL